VCDGSFDADGSSRCSSQYRTTEASTFGSAVTVNGALTVGSGQNATMDTRTLKVDGSNDRVGVGTADPATTFEVNGTSTMDAVTVTTLDTGQGANKLYDMNQNLNTSSSVVLAELNVTGAFNESQALCVKSGGNIGWCTTNLSATGSCTCA